jgi:hypothetical protein
LFWRFQSLAETLCINTITRILKKQTITYHQWAPLINTYYVIGKQTITYHQWAPLINTYYIIGKQTITYHQWAPLINTYYVIGKQTITYHQWAPLINTYYVIGKQTYFFKHTHIMHPYLFLWSLISTNLWQTLWFLGLINNSFNWMLGQNMKNQSKNVCV